MKPEIVEFEIDALTEEWPDGSVDRGYGITIKVQEDGVETTYAFGADEYSAICCESLDETVDTVKKWCRDRGYQEPLVMFTLKALIA
jgi:hypothetical protein